MSIEEVLRHALRLDDSAMVLCTGRTMPRRDVLRCVKAGFLVSAGMCEMADDDGDIIEGRKSREGFELTEKGRAMLAEIDEETGVYDDGYGAAQPRAERETKE